MREKKRKKSDGKYLSEKQISWLISISYEFLLEEVFE